MKIKDHSAMVSFVASPSTSYGALRNAVITMLYTMYDSEGFSVASTRRIENDEYQWFLHTLTLKIHNIPGEHMQHRSRLATLNIIIESSDIWIHTLLKGLRMVASALWRSEARRVVPWLSPCTSRRRVQGRSQGTTLSASDLHNALATILNPFYNMGIIKMTKNDKK